MADMRLLIMLFHAVALVGGRLEWVPRDRLDQGLRPHGQEFADSEHRVGRPSKIGVALALAETRAFLDLRGATVTIEGGAPCCGVARVPGSRLRVAMIHLRAPKNILNHLAIPLICGLLATACSETGAVGPISGTVIGDIGVTLVEPKLAEGAALLASGPVKVVATIKPSAGVKIAKVQAVLPNGTTVALTLQNGQWQGTLDTHNMVKDLGTKACGKKARIEIAATGTKEEAGTAGFDVDIDHCPPVCKLEAPKVPGPGEPNPVFIGKLPVIGSISDSKFKSGEISYLVEGGDGTPVKVLDLPKAGAFKALLDREGEPTATLVVKCAAVDLAGNTTETTVSVSVLKRPSFLGNTDDGDKFELPINDALPIDFDDNGILDVVVATPTGLFARKAIPSQTAPDKGTGFFEDLETLKSNSLALVTTVSEAPIALTKVLATDLDGDGKALDVVGLGTRNGQPTVFAFFRVQVQDPAGTRFGYKLLDAKALDDEAKTAALADLNGDGSLDIIVGGTSDNSGLTTLLTFKEPNCKVDGTIKPCKDGSMAKALSATVFQQGVHKPVHKGLANITSIAVGDFYADGLKLPDICVGDGNRPYISCYRNQKGDGTLSQAEDAFYSADTPDTNLILAVKWSPTGGASDGPDLIYASKSGTVRWIRGDNATGKFIFTPGMRTFKGYVVTHMHVANIGPSGAPYLAFVGGERQVRVAPISPTDNSHITHCFRAWVVGGAVLQTTVGDFDNDGELDLLAVDAFPSGNPVFRGLGQGDFRAPRAYHLCARDPGPPYELREWKVNHLQVNDLTGDSYPDLIAVGDRSASMYVGSENPLNGGCPTLDNKILAFPVWPMHLWANVSGKPNAKPRAGEFNPNKENGKSGAAQSCQVDGTGELFGSPVGVAMGDMDGDKLPDMAIVRNESPYFLGDTGNATQGCPSGCPYADENEVNDQFGNETNDKVGICCVYFASSDKDKLFPLSGYGGGAPLKRANLFNFLAKDKAKPFGMDVGNEVTTPAFLSPAFAKATGVEPRAVALGDFNKDTFMDVAVALGANGSASSDPYRYIAPRVRIFAGLGLGTNSGKVKHAPQSGDVIPVLSPSGVWIGEHKVAYRALTATPKDLLVSPLGANNLPGVFVTTLAPQNAMTHMESKGSKGEFYASTSVVVGDGIQACTARDVNKDTLTDMLCASSNAISWLPGKAVGKGTTYESKLNLIEGLQQVAGVEVGDVNSDGLPDLIQLDREKHTVRLWLGDGKGGFALYDGILRPLTEVKSIYAVDFNNDGCIDLAVHSEFGVTQLDNLGCALK